MNNSSKVPVLKRINAVECRKLAWNYHIHVVNGEIIVEKEINLWVRSDDGRKWSRIYHNCTPLEWFNCYYENDVLETKLKEYNSHLFVNRDVIQFNGGYLKIQDTGLFEHLNARTNLSSTSQSPEFVSKLFSGCTPEKLGTSDTGRQEPIGRNIYLEAEVDLDISDEKLVFPLFYLPQENPSSEKYGAVRLAVKRRMATKKNEGVEDYENQLFWWISNKQYTESNPYELDGMHSLTVSQDTNWLKAIDDIPHPDVSLVYFEYYVNSIALNTILELKTLPSDVPNKQVVNIDTHRDYVVQHKFGVGEKEFYVGYDLENSEVFRGKIRRIFFDPNASCPECIP